MKIVISFIIFGVLHSTVGRLFPPFGCECSDFTYFNFQGETVSWIMDKLSNVLTFLFRKTNSSSQLWAILWTCSLLTFDIQGVPPIGWQLRTKFWKLKNHIYQKVSLVLNFLNKKLSDGSLKLGKIKLEVFLNLK